MMLETSIHVFAGDRYLEDEERGTVYSRCSEIGENGADVVYHPHAIQCSGSNIWACLDCGVYTGTAGES